MVTYCKLFYSLFLKNQRFFLKNNWLKAGKKPKPINYNIIHIIRRAIGYSRAVIFFLLIFLSQKCNNRMKNYLRMVDVCSLWLIIKNKELNRGFGGVLISFMTFDIKIRLQNVYNRPQCIRTLLPRLSSSVKKNDIDRCMYIFYHLRRNFPMSTPRHKLNIWYQC